MKKISIKEAEKFHGHLGPYLILGILAGELALNKLKCKKYFGLEVKVWGADKKPKSCLIDGLQLSTGATYGKGNIKKFAGRDIKIYVSNHKVGLKLALKDSLIQELAKTKTHEESETLAKRIFKLSALRFFDYRWIN